MSGTITQVNRSYGSSLCLQCSGLRFVIGRYGQRYRMCQRQEPRYPVQPQLACPSFEPLLSLQFRLSRGQALSSGQLWWVGPRPRLGLSFELGQSLMRGDFFVDESPQLEESAAPSSSLLWTPGLEEGRGQLSWSSVTERGFVLAWSARVVHAETGDLLTLS